MGRASTAGRDCGVAQVARTCSTMLQYFKKIHLVAPTSPEYMQKMEEIRKEAEQMKEEYVSDDEE
jgi:hypothetical protein